MKETNEELLGSQMRAVETVCGSSLMKWLSKSHISVKYLIMQMSGDIHDYGDSTEEEKNMPDAALAKGKEAIMEYVDRLKPMVKEEYLQGYDEIWLGILELKEVKAVIYDKGKQQDTTFNRNLLAQIIHLADVIYKPTANTVQMAQYLEPEKGIDHPVRQKLGEIPDKPIKKAVESYLKENLL